MRLLFFTFAALACALLSAMPPQPPNLKITTRSTFGSQSSTTTRYVKGPRSRVETVSSAGWAAKPADSLTYAYGHPRATIYQCDRRQVLTLDLEAREYTSYQINEKGYPVNARPRTVEPSGGTLTVTIETVDTGERREMFGYTARRVITKEKRVPGPGAISQGGETERDGWYIDLDVNNGCYKPRGKVGVGIIVVGSSSNNNKRDKIEVQHRGVRETGFPVRLTTRTRQDGPNGKSEFIGESTIEVIELSTAALDPALFELPEGFKKVDRLDDQPFKPSSLQPLGTWDRIKQSLLAMFR